MSQVRLFLALSLIGVIVISIPLFSKTNDIRLTVLCYNIHHGEGTDQIVDLERIAGIINSVAPDIVALQEVDSVVSRTGNIDQAAELGRLTNMDYVFGKTIDFQGGKYGNAVLSRLPVQRFSNHPLPGSEQRAVLVLELKALPQDSSYSEDILFLATHFDHISEQNRLKSVSVISDIMQSYHAKPAILAGDLNDIPGSPVIDSLMLDWSNTSQQNTVFTFPTQKPEKQIDFILNRPTNRWKLVDLRVLNEPTASDHLPILAVLDLVILK